MSFTGERAVHYLGDQIQCYWLTCYIKTPVVLKQQKFEDREIDTTEQRKEKAHARRRMTIKKDKN